MAVLTLSLGGAGVVSAEPSTQPPPPGAPAPDGRPHKRMGFLTPEEQTKLENARKQALANDPSIQADMDAIKQQRELAKQSGVKPTPEERQAMMAKMKGLKEKTDAAMVKADPSIAPIMEKIKAHHQEMMQKFGEKRAAKKDGTGGGQSAAGTPLAPTAK